MLAPSETDFRWIETDAGLGDFVPVHKASSFKCNAKESGNGEMESLNINVSAEVNEEVEKEELQLFICHEEGCRRSFQRYGSLQNHVLYGRHDKEREKVCLIDRAKQGYAMRLEMQYGAVPSKQPSYIYVEDEDGVVTEMGWALQQQRAKTRFNVKQKEFLCKKFEEGGITGNKHKPDDVAQEMRTAKDAMGKRVFAAEEFIIEANCFFLFSPGCKKAQCHLV